MIKQKDYKGHTIRIIYTDAEVESPREYEPFGTLVTVHRNYDYSDSGAPKLSANDFNGWDEVEKHLIKKEGASVILPVYLLDHSGTSVSTTPFQDRWDSGQMGFIYVKRDDILSDLGGKRLSKNLRERAARILQEEVEYFDQWLRGEAYGFVIDPADDEDIIGALEEYSSGYYEQEMAEEVAEDTVDTIVNIENELALIKNLPTAELPKYINHAWSYPHVSVDAFKERLKEEG